MSILHEWRYPTTNTVDLKWGMVAYSFGSQTVGPGEDYPPKTAIAKYVFNPEKGRIIDEYQLVYLTKGRGTFTSTSLVGKKVPVKAGDAFLLFPGEWHSYMPDVDSGWEEYWIDFEGNIPDLWQKYDLLDRNNPVLHIGIKDDILQLYRLGETILLEQNSAYQQALCGICSAIIGLAVFYDKNSTYESICISEMVNQARDDISENLATIKAPDMAKDSHYSYSKFRKDFKNFTGISPGAYIKDIRISKAREFLTNTDKSIKEIAYECGFGNADYFCVIFKKTVGMTASEYRKRTRFNI